MELDLNDRFTRAYFAKEQNLDVGTYILKFAEAQNKELNSPSGIMFAAANSGLSSKEQEAAVILIDTIKYALSCNLPSGKVIERFHLNVQKNNNIFEKLVGRVFHNSEFTIELKSELEELFGHNFQDYENFNLKDKIKVLNNLLTRLDKYSPVQKEELLNNKISYEVRYLNSENNKNEILKDEYNQMISLIEAWKPLYKNNSNFDLESTVNAYFSNLKEEAIKELLTCRTIDCYTNFQCTYDESEYKIHRLKENGPEIFFDKIVEHIKSHLQNYLNKYENINSSQK